jgi:hypothetical protein
VKSARQQVRREPRTEKVNHASRVVGEPPIRVEAWSYASACHHDVIVELRDSQGIHVDTVRIRVRLEPPE